MNKEIYKGQSISAGIQFVIMIVIVILIMILTVWAISNMKEIKSAGEWGDVFGGATALFSGLAFAGLWSSNRLQSIQLNSSIDSLYESQKEQSEINRITRLATESQALTLLVNSYSFTREWNQKQLEELRSALRSGVGVTPFTNAKISKLKRDNDNLSGWIAEAQVRLNQIMQEIATPPESSPSVNTTNQNAQDTSPGGE